MCLGCNTALGHIERKYDLARAYLDSPPGQLLAMRQQAALLPQGLAFVVRSARSLW